jgi:hypothetical protein
MTIRTATVLALGIGSVVGATFGTSREALASHRYIPASGCSAGPQTISSLGLITAQYFGQGFGPTAYCPFFQDGIVSQSNDNVTFYDNQIKNIWVSVYNGDGSGIEVFACTVTSVAGSCGAYTGSHNEGTYTLDISGVNLSNWTQDKSEVLLPYVQVNLGDNSKVNELLGVEYTTF